MKSENKIMDKKKAAPALVYLGPSFYGIIQRGTVMKGEYLPKFGALLEQHPFLSGLVVPVEQLAEKRGQLSSKESELSALYRKAEQIKEERNV